MENLFKQISSLELTSGLLPNALQAVAGILFKYVNLGKGWRPRFFVLHDGVLTYYKVIYFCSIESSSIGD